nr:hypothetical protein [uncultured Cohaesibacter sp.]
MLDFLELFSGEDLQSYDYIVLYTGIVDWSPRPASSAYNNLYNNKEITKNDNLRLNTRDYSKKIINNKKAIFDSVFGEAEINSHLNSPFPEVYEGEKTNNMYSLDMAFHKLLPRLASIDNLIFINSNRFVPGWEGDYIRKRPANIAITESYSALFLQVLGKEKTVDLLNWDYDDVKKYTCDNLHLSKEGSDYIYDEILKKIEQRERERASRDSILIIGNGPSTKKVAEYGFANLPKNLHTFGMGAAYRYFSKIN